jgi:tellurite resistance protein
MIDHMTALIYTMILVSAADRNMTDAELRSIGEIVSYLPIFKKFDMDKLPKVAADCAEILDDDNGLDKALEVIKGALPQRLHETAYAVACDVAAADGHIKPEVIRLLELLRHALGIDRLAAAAIERAARARHTVL